MKKIILITLLWVSFPGAIFPQNGVKLSKIDQETVEKAIADRSRKIESLRCDFLQEKTSSLFNEKSVSQGVMIYKAPDKLRWEYKTPKASTLIIRKEGAALLDPEGRRTGNPQLLKQLGNMIIQIINGQELGGGGNFTSGIYKKPGVYFIELKPVSKRMKEVYSSIGLSLDAETLLALEITLNEKTGDKTTIFLRNTAWDTAIPDGQFDLP